MSGGAPGGGRASGGLPTGGTASGGAAGDAWSGERAERHLRSLELFGMRFGLDRMRRMMTVLGSPQQRLPAIHVVGTNGKTSTTRMTAAILQRHGLRTGSYTSPHLVHYSERVEVEQEQLSSGAFAAAVARAAWAAERVNRTLAEDDHVTQFELLTAAAFAALAERGVEVAVVEAGLGGRFDATSVVESRVTVLTNVGLEHTRWLGPTLRDIAGEKLAVLRPGTTLALGAGLDAEVMALARALAGERGAEIVQVAERTRDARGAGSAPESPELPAGGTGNAPESTELRARAVGDARESPEPLRARGEFQRANFALARLAAGAYLAGEGIELDEEAVRAAARETIVRGRLEVLGEDPLTIIDGAHNPDAVAALVRSLPELLGGRKLALVLGVLEDKDATEMLRALLGLCARAWFTAPPSARALSPATLESLARQQGFTGGVGEPQPARALAQAQAWAREQGDDGAVLATGSIYLVGDLLEHAGEQAGEHRRAEN